MKGPTHLDFTPEQVEELTDRLCKETLRKEDYPILANILKAVIWMNLSLQEKKLSIQPWLQVEVYRPERLRCSVCGKTFTATLPMEIMTGSRADSSAKAIVSLLKYRGGVPFYRQGEIQKILDAPISPSEIWEMTEDVADAVQPVYALLCKHAASAELIQNDDTKARILSIMEDREKRKGTEEEDKRSGIFTTGVLATLSGLDVKIALFFTGIFANEKSAPSDPLSRLKWHQEQSGPIMREMKAYCDNLMEEKEVEPNSSMGKAIAYLQNHWDELTLFLRMPGVPIDNNATERMLKKAVLNRKNAYFYRNETGAKIGDILMSVIETSALNKINPWEYLIAIQKYQEDVRANPNFWIPWLYEERVKELQPAEMQEAHRQ